MTTIVEVGDTWEGAEVIKFPSAQRDPVIGHCEFTPFEQGDCRQNVSIKLGPDETGDLKVGRRGLKPPLHWIPMWALQGVARVFGYGARKYAPGNWVKAANEPNSQEALCDYMSAAQRHWAAIQAADGSGMAFWDACDIESDLPHIDHLICSLIMLRGIGQLSDVLQSDPGQGNEPVK